MGPEGCNTVPRIKPTVTQVTWLWVPVRSLCVLSRSSHVQLFATMWTSPPGSSVRGILQARTLEWVAISSSRGSSWPRDRTRASCIDRLSHQGSPYSPKVGSCLYLGLTCFRKNALEGDLVRRVCCSVEGAVNMGGGGVTPELVSRGFCWNWLGTLTCWHLPSPPGWGTVCSGRIPPPLSPHSHPRP